MCKTGSTTKGAKSARTPNPTALCARACRFLYHPSALVSSLWSLVSGLWSWVLGPGSWGWSWGRSNCCFLKATTPNLPGRPGPCRAVSDRVAQLFSHPIFGLLTDVVLDAFWPPKVAQRLPKSVRKSSQNRHRQPPPQRLQRSPESGPFWGRFSIEFHRFSRRFLMPSATRFEVVFQNSASQKI